MFGDPVQTSGVKTPETRTKQNACLYLSDDQTIYEM